MPFEILSVQIIERSRFCDEVALKRIDPLQRSETIIFCFVGKTRTQEFHRMMRERQNQWRLLFCRIVYINASKAIYRMPIRCILLSIVLCCSVHCNIAVVIIIA